MQIRLYYILFLMVFSTEVFAQGFSWQYSHRMPSSSPLGFIGLHTEYGLSSDFGDINLSEYKIPCCTFKTGTSGNFSIGAVGEYWVTPIEALNIKLNYNSKSGEYSTDSEPVFYRNDTLFTNYVLDKSISYLSLDLSYKRRLYESQFLIKGGLCFGLLLANDYSIIEKISSGDLTFNDGSQSRQVKAGSISEFSSFVISPQIGLAYNFEIAKGMYSSAEFNVSYTLNSIASDASWRAVKYSLGISCFIGIIN